MFHAVNEALDTVSEAINGLIEGTCSGFIPSPGNRDPDMMVRKILPYGAAFFPFRFTAPVSMRRYNAVASWRCPWGKRKGDEFPVTVRSQMDLCRVPALAVAERFAFLPLFF